MEGIKLTNISITQPGIELTSISLEKFMSYKRKTDINFIEREIVITGPTGSGKTSILDAITFALYGKTSRTDPPANLKIEDICNLGGYVKLNFLCGGKNVSIIRGRDIKGKSSLDVLIEENRIAERIPELTKLIEKKLVGLDYKSFSASSFIRQDEMKLLGSRTGQQRIKLLQNLFHLDVFEKAMNDIQEDIEPLNRKLSDLNGQMRILQEDLQKLPELERKIKILDKDKQETEKNLISKQEKEEKMEKLIEQKKIFLENKKTIVKQFEENEKRLKDVNISLTKSKTIQKEFIDLKKQITTLEENIKDEDQLSKLLNSLEDKHINYKNTKLKIEDTKKNSLRVITILQNQINKILTEKSKLQSRIENIDTTIDQDQAFRLLNQEGRFEERLDRICMEKNWLSEKKDIVEQILSEEGSAKLELTEIRKNVKKINKDSFVLTEIKNSINKTLEELKINENQTQEESKRFKEVENSLNVELKKINFSDDDLKIMSRAQQDIEKIKKIKHDYLLKKEKMEKLSNQESLIISLEKDVVRLTEKLKTGSQVKKEIEDITLDITKREKDEKELNTEIKKLEDSRLKINGEFVSLKNKFNEITNKQNMAEKIKKEQVTLKKELDTFNLLRSRVFHPKGIPLYAINKILPKISQTASEILTDLTDKRFTTVIMEPSREGAYEGFSIQINTPDGLRDITALSGGERTQVNAAIRLAISQELANIGQAQKSLSRIRTLFIDEGDLGSLDTLHSQQAFVSKLLRLKEKFHKVILITHMNEIAEQFPNRIYIGLDSEGYSTVITNN